MYVLYPQPGEVLCCAVCLTSLPSDKPAFGESDMLDDYWCDACTDFVEARVRKVDERFGDKVV